MYARPQTRDRDYERLVRTSYGLPPAPVRRRHRSRSVTLSADTGTDVIPQPGADTGAPGDLTEYVVDREPLALPPAPEPPAPVAPIVPPVADAPGAAEPPAPPPPMVAPTPEPQPAPVPVQPAEPMPMPTAAPAPAPAPAPPTIADTAPAPASAPSNGRVSEDELAADMQAILSGAKVYDPSTGTMRSRSEVGTPLAPPEPVARPMSAAGAEARPADPGRPMPDSPNQQAIFDRIKESMEYANSFDLGSVDLHRRFDQFDRRDDVRRSTAPAATAMSLTQGAVRAAAPAAEPTAPPPTDAEYRAAYDQDGPWSALPNRTASCGPSALAMTLAPERSTAMFDTGEHVLAAGDLYPDQLRVANDGSVSLSYGQVLSMPDFYDSVDDLRQADPSEARTLKELIVRNTSYYRDGKRNPADDISNETWSRATNKRYLRLAEENYSHFSPPSVLGMTFTTTKPDNRGEWIKYHSRAAHEMRALLKADPKAAQPTSAMTTNAFGDHYLTDAFASGHLVNKELVLDMFRRNFFSAGHLNEAGKQFFAAVAAKSWHGDVVKEISGLETTSYPLCAWGYCVPWRPNIDSASRFAQVLQGAAEAEPVKIGNLALKALHDHLNKVGVRVTNDAGAAEWTLTGDGHLNQDTKVVMQRAVQQSVDNLLDAAILAPTLDMLPLCERVMRHLPKPTPAGLAQVNAAVATYTDPASTTLQDDAAVLIKDQLGMLKDQLVNSGKLKKA